MSLLRSTRASESVGGFGSLGDRLFGRSSTSVTSRSAMQQSVVWAACRLRADLVSLMPVDVYRKRDGVNVSVPPPPVLVTPSEIADGHPMSVGEWLGAGQMSLDRFGNSFGVIRKVDAFGLPAAIDLVSPEDVSARIRDGKILHYTIGGERHDPRHVWHERQFTVAGLPIGLSPIAHAALNLAGGISAQQFAVDWFENGTVPGAILKNSEKTIPADEAAKIKRRFKASVQSGDVFVTGKDWTYEAIAAKAAESGFISQMQYSDVALTRFFGVPADLVDVPTQSSTLSYANITQRNLQLLVMNLGAAVKRRDEALSSGLLPAPRFVRLNRDAVLAMDAKSRAELFELQIKNRTRTPDQVRALEDQLPLSDEDYAQFDRLWPARTPTQPPTSGGN